MDEFYYPSEGDDAYVVLQWVADHLEMIAMCLSCSHYGKGCPKDADAERPCNKHSHVDSMTAENLTDDLKHMLAQIEKVKDLEAFFKNSMEEEKGGE